MWMFSEMIIIFVLIGVFFIGVQPTIMVYPPEDDCQRVHITRFWEQVTIIDATMCGDQEFKFNGENLLGETDE